MPTQLQRDQLRYDLSADEDTMNDGEIDFLYSRAETKYPNSTDAVEASVRLMAINALLIQASKRNDYTANRSTEKLSQLFSNLLKLRPIFLQDLKDAENDDNPGVRYGQLRRAPSRLEEYPDPEMTYSRWGIWRENPRESD